MNITYKVEKSIQTDEIKEQIWQILCECDKEFIPALSARESSTQGNLNNNTSLDVKPQSYFENMITQNFILAIDEETGSLVGFMTFRSNYHCEELKDYAPSNYITTICVKKDYRNHGITKGFYEVILENVEDAELASNFVTTRTWSTNDAHIHLLNKLGFINCTTLKNHRGEGIDTVYFAKNK